MGKNIRGELDYSAKTHSGSCMLYKHLLYKIFFMNDSMHDLYEGQCVNHRLLFSN